MYIQIHFTVCCTVFYGIYILQYFGFAMHFFNSSDLTGMMVIWENLSTKTHGCTLTKSQFNFDATYCWLGEHLQENPFIHGSLAKKRWKSMSIPSKIRFYADFPIGFQWNVVLFWDLTGFGNLPDLYWGQEKLVLSTDHIDTSVIVSISYQALEMVLNSWSSQNC